MDSRRTKDGPRMLNRVNRVLKISIYLCIVGVSQSFLKMKSEKIDRKIDARKNMA